MKIFQGYITEISIIALPFVTRKLIFKNIKQKTSTLSVINKFYKISSYISSVKYIEDAFLKLTFLKMKLQLIFLSGFLLITVTESYFLWNYRNACKSDNTAIIGVF